MNLLNYTERSNVFVILGMEGDRKIQVEKALEK